MSTTRRSPLLSLWLLLGYTFLYAPIVILIIFSFNESKLVTVWAGFSTKWYGELLQDKQMLSAAWLSLRLALMSATAAVALGVLAGFVMARFGRFRGHNIFAGMITAPLVMPEVITGLSMLLLFVSMEKVIGWPDGRGLLTLWFAHVTFMLGLCGRGYHLQPQRNGYIHRRGGHGSRRTAFQGVHRDHTPDYNAGGCLRLAAGLHAVPGRPGHIEFCGRPRCNNTPHESVFQCAPGSQPENQCPGNHRRTVRLCVCRRWPVL